MARPRPDHDVYIDVKGGFEVDVFLVKILKRIFCNDFETNFCLNLRS